MWIVGKCVAAGQVVVGVWRPYSVCFIMYIWFQNLRFDIQRCRVSTLCPEKKGTNSIWGITSSNTDRFSKCFHFYNLLEICNKAVIKYPIAPKMRHYTTLWNIDVRKLSLACPDRCGILAETRQNSDVLQAAAFQNETCLLPLLLLTYSINFRYCL